MRRAGALSVIASATALAIGGQAIGAGSSSSDVAGQAYAQNCASCHGEGLGGRFGPALTGPAFVAKWGGQSAAALADYLQETMPPAAPKSLPAETYAALAGFLRSANGLSDAAAPAAAAPAAPAPPAGEAQDSRAEARPLSVRGMDNDPYLRAHEARLDRLKANLKPVTDAMLDYPAEADWPTWRRSRVLHGSTPLRQIDKANAGKLAVAWALSLKPGSNGFEPLVQDGVMFVNTGNEIQALDASNGDVIWEYGRQTAPTPMPLTQARGMTLYKGRLYVPTLDAHMLALDARSGRLIWDRPLSKREDQSFVFTGAPIAVKGKIIQGVSGCFGQTNPGGCFIVAFDAEDGHEAWRFNTIARPGQPGGNSWNGAPLDKRFGGSVWAGGSYDPELNLVFFGVGQTYKITTLLNPAPASSKATRDALYTDTTLALNPDTGALVWHYQHMAGDVWDLDWSFERSLVTLPGRSGPVKAIVTASKGALVDVIEARSGKYLWSADLGIQSLVTAIDPRTGRKTIDPRQVPVKGEMRTVCPSALGGRNWLASAVAPQEQLIFFPLLEACMDIGLESSASLGDFKLVTRSRPDSDGKFGRILALDLRTRKFRWVDRMRAAPASAILTTSGGILFEGGRDRWFRARDEDTGAVLWQTRLDDVPNGFPISYAADGRQYVAVVTGGNTPYDYGVRGLTPEIRASSGARTLWVFALPAAK